MKKGGWEPDWIDLWWSMTRGQQFRLIFVLSLTAWLAITALVWGVVEITGYVYAHVHSDLHLIRA